MQERESLKGGDAAILRAQRLTDVRQFHDGMAGDWQELLACCSVTVEVFPSSTLHGWSEGVDALQGGVSDIS